MPVASPAPEPGMLLMAVGICAPPDWATAAPAAWPVVLLPMVAGMLVRNPLSAARPHLPCGAAGHGVLALASDHDLLR